MAKKRRPIFDSLVYLLLRGFVALIQALTPDAGRSLARAIGALIARVDRRHREIALDNLRRAMPGRFTEDQLRRLVVRVYQHFVMMIVEIAHIPRKIHPTN